MIALSKPTIALAALIAAGFVTLLDMAQSRPEPSAAAVVAARFPTDETMAAPMIDKTAPAAERASPAKSERRARAGCAHEHWPSMADACLISTDGERPRRPSRTIAIERQAAVDAAAVR
ncbi:MAG: hypothetical protein IRZ09_06635 [Variibacter sp.]|nr:hypothetical protein [Variibacter sp.]